MIAEVCKEFGWTVDYILKMPVRQFFAIRNSMYQLSNEESAMKYIELCDIQAIAIGDARYYSELRSSYRNRLIDTDDIERKNRRESSPRCFKADDMNDMEIVKGIMKDAFRQKAKLSGLAY